MDTVIVEGRLADIDGVRRAQIAIENGVIAAVGANLGPPAHVFGENCLIFAGMGDIHIHAREDITGKETHKETFATVSAAALHGGVLHVADMPNNPAAPIDERSYAAKEALVKSRHLPVVFTLYAGIGPGTKPLVRRVPYKAYMGPSVGDLYFSTLEDLDETLAHYAGQAVSFHCEDPVLLEKHKTAPTHEAPAPRMRTERHQVRAGHDREVWAQRQIMSLLGSRRLAAHPRRQGERPFGHSGGDAAPHLFRYFDDHAGEPPVDADEPASAGIK